MQKKTVNDLTVEEKLRLICAKDNWSTVDLNGKIPSVSFSDGPIGLRTVIDGQTSPSVAYPSTQVLANTWSVECTSKMGAALADDSHERNVDILLAPGVNIKRHPLCGRNFEYFSEDPYLTGILAREYIKSVQDRGIGVSLKHFLANNLEYDRLHQSSEIDERTLREVYYKPFEIACESKPVTIMSSYNRINGVLASEHKKIFDVLRNELGFDGAIISDWDAVRNRVKSAKAGLDLEMPFNPVKYEKLVEEYNEGKLTNEELNQNAARVLDLVYRCKEMKKDKKIETTVEDRIKIAKDIAAQGIVLLKNNGILPINKDANIAICGAYAKPDDLKMINGGGSAKVKWLDEKFDIPDALQRKTEGKVLYEGAFGIDGINSGPQQARKALINAAIADVNIVCVGTGADFESEASERKVMYLTEDKERAILETAEQNPNTIVVIFAGSAIDVSAWEAHVSAILYAGFPGMGGDEVITDILMGNINPSGKLSETFPVKFEDHPASQTYRSAGVTDYGEGLNVGYRYFDRYGIIPQYPFGFGLSYSIFEYRDLRLNKKGDLNLEVSYFVDNVSNIEGYEVSQVYVRECAPLVYRPYKELKGFSKDLIKANGQINVKINLDKSSFSYYSTAIDSWHVEDGVYEIMVGKSSRDIALKGKIIIKDGKII